MNIKDWLSWQMIQGVIRQVLTSVGTGLAGAGILTADQANVTIGAVMVIAGVIAEVVSSRTKKKAMAIAKAVDMSDDVEAVKTASGKVAVRAIK
jgi:hypothetical protein